MKINQNPNLPGGQTQKISEPQTKRIDSSVRVQSPQAPSIGSQLDTKSIQGDLITSGARPEISSKARELLEVKEAALKAPDVREEKIAELRRRIENKEYNVKPDDIAEKLVREHLETSSIG